MPKRDAKAAAEQPRTDGLLRPYAIITDRICAMLEQGVVPWGRPWNVEAGAPMSLASGKAYRGVNVFMLEATAAMSGYRSHYWLTFKQALERGGNVKKSEHATPVVFWKILEKSGDRKDDAGVIDDADESADRKIPLLKHYNVFNVEQCEGIDYPTPQPAAEHPFDPIIACEQIVQTMPRPPTIEHRGNRACYAPLKDEVTMPPREQFHRAEEYYSTLFHELTHASGHVSRLNRDGITKHAGFGSDPYAKEELIAEMGAAFLCSRACIEQATLENSASYIQGWLTRLRNEPKLVVLAAAAAQKAADYILAENQRENADEQQPPATQKTSTATIAAIHVRGAR